jgi:hypothetical protein
MTLTTWLKVQTIKEVNDRKIKNGWINRQNIVYTVRNFDTPSTVFLSYLNEIKAIFEMHLRIDWSLKSRNTVPVNSDQCIQNIKEYLSLHGLGSTFCDFPIKKLFFLFFWGSTFYIVLQLNAVLTIVLYVTKAVGKHSLMGPSPEIFGLRFFINKNLPLGT